MDAPIEKLINGLPDGESASRFLASLAEKHPGNHAKLEKNAALLSDVVTLVAFSPLLAATLLQNPEYLWWLNRKRRESGVRGKEELLESLARFSMTNSQLEPQVLFARFRRRELLRIYLRDIRRLATIAEITEEISNLADAILESALKLARREMDNRFGPPLETDEKGRSLPARFCIAALGKLGSRELNYSSDIDLLFLYSNEGSTSGGGTRGSVTNHEYFGKLAEYAARLVASSSGEGAAYRVDLRLRPHGTLGALALSLNDTIRYYQTEARGWERQVMIRSRGCAGDIELFKEFFAAVEDLVFSTNETVETAIANVSRSKEKIDLENISRRGYNVKLGRGGIREIEFISQALQLAHGGRDRWLRSPHTLISLSRLADRAHLSSTELSQLSSAYAFLRRTEHALQMENGNQTHTVPDEPEKRALLARRMTFAAGGDFESDLKTHTGNVSRIYSRVFGSEPPVVTGGTGVLTSGITSGPPAHAGGTDLIASVSPHFAAMIDANPRMTIAHSFVNAAFDKPDYNTEMMATAGIDGGLRRRLASLRRTWQAHLLGIAVADIYAQITIREAKRLQTLLAEASIAAALEIVQDELAKRYSMPSTQFPLSVLALGKLGGRGLDYGSDLDLIMVYDDTRPIAANVTHAEYYGRAVELFVTVLSSITRDGNLYRVDLRLRPFGSKGMSAMSAGAFIEYIRETAAIWEMLAFVKLRAVGGDMELASSVERETRSIIHERAAAINARELREETRRVRLALEKKHSRARRGKEVDIKYGSGGMLDVYFSMRYLQLRDNVPDGSEPPASAGGTKGEPNAAFGPPAHSGGSDFSDDRSTVAMLKRLAAHARSSTAEDSLSSSLHSQLSTLNSLSAGYEFLSTLDHNLRLTVGRTTRVPLANQTALAVIAARMNLASAADLLEQLTLHRLAIRSAFECLVT